MTRQAAVAYLCVRSADYCAQLSHPTNHINHRRVSDCLPQVSAAPRGCIHVFPQSDGVYSALNPLCRLAADGGHATAGSTMTLRSFAFRRLILKPPLPKLLALHLHANGSPVWAWCPNP